MKLLSFALLTGMLLSSISQANTLVACRKRNPLVYSAFTWVQIERLQNQELIFRYGNGIQEQMLEVYFDSAIEQRSANEFHFQNSQYELSATIEKKKLSFTLSGGGKTATKKNFECIVLPQLN